MKYQIGQRVRIIDNLLPDFFEGDIIIGREGTIIALKPADENPFGISCDYEVDVDGDWNWTWFCLEGELAPISDIKETPRETAECV